MSERRYDETEIRAIFARAAEEQDQVQRRLGSEDGLTLAELALIGEEAGLSPDFVARAAASLDRLEPALPPTRLLGLPVGVSRSVYLDTPLTDHEWELLISDLRYTFNAKGKERSTGYVREWRNGNLCAIAERSDGGYRLRMGTHKGNAKSNLLLIAGSTLIALVALSASVFGGDSEAAFPGYLFGSAAVALVISTVLSVPRWAATRSRQMEGIAERLVERAGAQTGEGTSTPLLDMEADDFERDAAAAHNRVRS